jgi:hypothetical protein
MSSPHRTQADKELALASIDGTGTKRGMKRKGADGRRSKRFDRYEVQGRVERS